MIGTTIHHVISVELESIKEQEDPHCFVRDIKIISQQKDSAGKRIDMTITMFAKTKEELQISFSV